MIDRINKLIEVNLSLFYTAENNTLSTKCFKDEVGNRLQHAKVFAGIMQKKELIIHNPNEEVNYILTPLGKSIAENGGWLEYLKKLKKEESQIPIEEFQNSERDTEALHENLIMIAFILVLLIFLIVIYYTLYNKK